MLPIVSTVSVRWELLEPESIKMPRLPLSVRLRGNCSVALPTMVTFVCGLAGIVPKLPAEAPSLVMATVPLETNVPPLYELTHHER